MSKWIVVVFLLLACSTIAATAPHRDLKKEAEICRQLQAIDPQAVPIFQSATAAVDKQDYAKALPLYHQVVARNPTFDPAVRRVAEILAYLGQYDEAISQARQAVALKRSADNLTTLAFVLVTSTPEGNAPQREEALTLLQEANRLARSQDVDILTLLAQVALSLDRKDIASQTIQIMESIFPQNMNTHFMLGMQAATEHRWITAENEIRRAQRLGLPAATANRLLSTGIHRLALIFRVLYTVLILTGCWLLGLLLLFIGGRLMSGMTMRSIESADPNVGPNPHELRLRSRYRTLISIAGTYYYLSLPFVIMLVLACVGGILLFFMWIGTLPIKLLLIIGIVALVTIYQSVKSIFLRFSDEESGRPLREDEAPEFWRLVREVAHAVGTRPVDEIRVLPGTDMAVYEHGKPRDRAHDNAKRVLLLGVGLLNGFAQNAFRSVLAHEYGHFSHRDTAGGDIAIRINATMMSFAIGMARSGAAVTWNIGFQFLRCYHFLFRRISYGATRLQEVLADRVAVLNYGATAFETGLRHVVQRSLEFDAIVNTEVKDALNTKRGLANVYTLPATASDTLTRKVDEELSRATTADDTHPSPVDRFRLTQRIHAGTPDTASGQVWELFRDREALEREMCGKINGAITSQTGVTLPPTAPTTADDEQPDATPDSVTSA